MVRKPAKRSDGPEVMGISLTNAGRELWPDGGGGRPVSKLDLARYYETVGAWMMPHVEGRPVSIVRMPGGIGGPRFFQRHPGKGANPLIEPASVGAKGKPYIVINRIEALAALAQIGTVELHPWNCRAGEPEVPGRLIFDLDPDEALNFPKVIDAACEVKARMEALGLAAFCKTTGGKGLHVVVPLAAEKTAPAWKTAKAFAREVCARMAADSPDRYTVNMAKAKRGGRIFLDYLRNDRTSTAVAPFSPRGRPGAPVSFPLTWDQVVPSLDPKGWTVRNVPPLLDGLKAWADYAEAERPLSEAAARLKAA